MDRTESSHSAASAASLEEAKSKSSRERELRATCRIPSEEVCLDDFICALKRNMIYQGRIFVFEHYVCFDSLLFGKQKTVALPLKDVTLVKKRKFMGFPNSLEIIYKGRNFFFTSFLRREEAYKLILFAWEKSSPYAKLFGASGRHSDLSPSDSKRVLGSRHLAKWVTKSFKSEDGDPAEMGTEPKIERVSQQPSGSEVNTPGSTNGDYHDDYESDSDESDHGSTTTGTQDEMDRWEATDEPPPAIEPGMTKLVEAQLDVTVQTFYKEFLSDESQFFISWHQNRGDANVQLSQWRKQHQVGYVRDLTFITPLKQKIGPSKCLCTQTQRTRLHPGQHLVFNTSQIMDIPYGDYFSVNTQWDIVPAEDKKACKVTMHLAIPFSKKTMFKSTIESNTKQQMTTAYEDWLSTARKWMEDPIPIPKESIQPTPPKTCFANGQAFPEDSEDTGPTHFSRAQSLSMRLSRDGLSDRDLLKRIPTANRPEVARVLQYKDSGTQNSDSALSKKASEQNFGKRVGFDIPGDQQIRPILQSSLRNPVVWCILGFMVAILAFRIFSFLLGSSNTGRNEQKGNDAKILPQPSDLAIKEDLREIKVALTILQQQLGALTESLQTKIAK